MTKGIHICMVAATLFGVMADAEIRNEWSFEEDAAGTTLTHAINSGSDGSTFGPGGVGLLEVDGQGLLQSTPAGVGGLWDGVELDADIEDQTSLYLRYDLEYDLTWPYYANGVALGISFVDGAGEPLVGLMSILEVDDLVVPAGKTLLQIATGLETSGTLSAIARVFNNTITVWYKMGLTNDFVESEYAEQVTVPLSTISGLRVQASGDAFPSGSSEYIAMENIRTADTWEEITTVVDIGQVLSEDEITIRVAPGETASASIELFNTSRDVVPFRVTDDGRRPGNYSAQQESALRYPFGPASLYLETVFDWQDGESVPLELGFDFPMFGNAYTRFSVDQYGKLILLSDDDLEAGVVPFESSSTIDPATIRYRKEPGRLIVAWGNDDDPNPGAEFQAWLNADGTIQYFYELGTWNGWVGLIDEQGRRYFVDYTPGEVIRSESLLIKLVPWVIYSPEDGSVAGRDSETLTFTASPSSTQNPGTNQFTVFVQWGEQIDEIDVTVIVEPKILQLDVPGTFNFTGPAGSISPDAVMTVTNSGNVSLTYTLFNSGLRDAGYAGVDSDYSWVQVPDIPQYELDSSQLDSEPVSMGFPFVFFGNTITELIVGVDGTLSFSNGESIVPFSAGQQMGFNSSVRAFTSADSTRFVVTWDYLVQPDGKDDQRFQAVLHRDGRIQFNYRYMTEGWQDGAIELNGPFTLSGSLVNDQNIIVEDVYETISVTNDWIGGVIPVVSTTNVFVGTQTNYISPIIERVIEVMPGSPDLISYSPVSATLPVGATADVILTGDARTLGASVTVDTTLIFNYSGLNSSSEVEFITTAAAAAAEVRAAMWGAEEPTVSSTMNVDGSRSLFWPAPRDSLSRIYKIWYTLSLAKSWALQETVTNLTTYLDVEHNDEPVIFYKVTVE